jgi:hypothetical protein
VSAKSACRNGQRYVDDITLCVTKRSVKEKVDKDCDEKIGAEFFMESNQKLRDAPQFMNSC